LIGTKALDEYVCSTKKKKEKLATNATAGRYPNEVNPVLYFERASERGKTLFYNSSSSSSLHDLIRKRSEGGNEKKKQNKTKQKQLGVWVPATRRRR
jgi:hypothetical protein